MKPLSAALALAFVLLPGAVAIAQPLTKAERTAVNAALARGRQLYRLDQAAWHASDVMLTQLPQQRHGELRGFIVEERGGKQIVTYYGVDGDEPVAVWVAEMRDGRALASFEVAPDGPRELTAIQKRMIQALDVVRSTTNKPCASALFNALVIPPARVQDPVEVYMLTPQTKKNIYPGGGHWKIVVGADGTVQSSRQFTKACMDLELPPDTVAIMMGDMLDPVPSELHVYLSQWTRRPIYVVAREPEQLWVVEGGGRMRKVTEPVQ